ncbi:tRNA (guanine(26)-N(2))-dimethyltransferase [Halovenus sp. WSH3]|uniref:tRNA (guanine(26)-N(2))-dimethyltransferase n=1 Tax=Halovenus carboxidivorans TaxID=2692199 RepID=A0A6B0T3K4_9EURY|nr:tRNA (guanine(26)-N(2))-dimethyltransferase [Halovenus carboxidivorans]MXR50053.1 tRNA (guanine(26)-N(2))-dimethyltransferase [Halovenus carboxidivorans]
MDVREGAVEIEVPEQEDGVGDGVFFNPVQELNRDLTLAVLRAYREREPRAETYLDAMTASGIRGVRAAADGWEVTCCDVDSDALDLCESNLARNDLDAETVQRDVNALLHEEYFDVVDLDPFGTPIPFADAAFQGTRNLLCVTATDTAPLCGAHFESGVRSYSAVPRNTEYHAEMGVRILLSGLARTGARYDIAVRPILTHATKHYVRTYLELDRGARDANAVVEGLGFIYHCEHCLYRDSEAGLLSDPPEACPNCGSAITTAGPVWLERICDPEFLPAVKAAVGGEMGTAEQARDLIDRLGAELDEPTHYDQHRLCEEWGEPAPAMDDFLEALRAAGFEASRTHYGGTTFKTTASVPEMRTATGPLF